jgi:hypothetical protein
MKIRKELTVQNVGGEDVILLQGKHGLDTTKIISLNETALWLWNRFVDRDDFTLAQVADSLVEEFGIDREMAAADAGVWVGMMLQNMLIEQ